MRVLIVKTSSMGDVIHTLPALTDACAAIRDIEFDWLVEPAFAEIPRWHKGVAQVISVPLRKLRKTPWQSWQRGEWQQMIQAIRKQKYDCIIDAQGLFKSAALAKCARGPLNGYARANAREKIATLFYDNHFTVPKGLHAVEKIRSLFAQVLSYHQPTTPPDYGIDLSRLVQCPSYQNAILFLHGTTWTTKHWPQKYWAELGCLATQAGYTVLLPWGNNVEQQRAESIRIAIEKNRDAHGGANAIVLPKLNLGQLTTLISKSTAVVAVDTGLGHISAAMAVPTVSLYGSTDPGLTGAYGPNQYHLTVQMECAPCFGRECKKGQNFAVQPPCYESLPPKLVWQKLLNIMVTNKYDQYTA